MLRLVQSFSKNARAIIFPPQGNQLQGSEGNSQDRPEASLKAPRDSLGTGVLLNVSQRVCVPWAYHSALVSFRIPKVCKVMAQDRCR